MPDKLRIPPFFSCLALLFILACNRPSFEKELKQLDSLNTTLSQVMLTLNAVDTTMIHERLSEQIEQFSFIHRNADTISRENAFVLDRYAQCKKAYSTWGKKLPLLKSEAQLRKNQLEDLRNDLEKALVESEEALTYVQTETKNIRQLADITTQMHKGLEFTNGRYDEIRRRVEEIIKEIQPDTVN